MSVGFRDMKPILCAGLVCLDQVTLVSSFPREDTDMRSLNQYKVNTAMTCDIQYHIHYTSQYATMRSVAT